MLTRVQALIAVLALSASASFAAPKSPPAAAVKPPAKPVLPRCDVKINQIAASVHLNRSKAPPSVCVLGCDAKLVGVRKEGNQLAALAIYSGRRCLPAGSSKAKPVPPSKAKPKAAPPPKPAAKVAPGVVAAAPAKLLPKPAVTPTPKATAQAVPTPAPKPVPAPARTLAPKPALKAAPAIDGKPTTPVPATRR